MKMQLLNSASDANIVTLQSLNSSTFTAVKGNELGQIGHTVTLGGGIWVNSTYTSGTHHGTDGFNGETSNSSWGWKCNGQWVDYFEFD